MHILEVKNLALSIPSPNGDPGHILNGISFHMRKGEILGLIGNSGCGKTMTAMTIAGLLPGNARINSGEILLDGKDLLKLSLNERRMLLGDDIGLVFQDPLSSLDPLMTIGKNLDEILRIRNYSKEERYDTIKKMLERVGFNNPDEIYKRYPHQLSGGQRQRVLIAGAALLKPRLLIADEPTSALDTVTTIQILELLRSICVEYKMTILFISHDLSVVNNFCDRVMVMNKGEIVDTDNTYDILHTPRSAYTADLLTKAKLDPRSLDLKFLPVDYSRSPILTVKDLSSGYKSGFFSSKATEKTISDINFEVYPDEIVGLIGSSGCGKTTLSKTMTGLLPKLSGSVELSSKITDGENASPNPIGVVFQDPSSCLNPAHTVEWHLNEPLNATHSKLNKEERHKLIVKTMKELGLEEKMLTRLTSKLSGGQKQRVAIAMCLILNPAIIIADEPFSSLDASSAASILKILADINVSHHTSIILISHNLHVVRTMCKRVLVMDKGSIVESGLVSEVLGNPKSDVTKSLLDAERKLST